MNTATSIQHEGVFIKVNAECDKGIAPGESKRITDIPF